jgi:hypothetical protein
MFTGTCTDTSLQKTTTHSTTTQQSSMTLPKLTRKQQEIIRLLYTYRFLNRKQIQFLLNHRDKKRIISWLKDLREKQYIAWIYPTDFTEKTKPAIYYLNLNGVRFLRQLSEYPAGALQRRYKEASRQQSFIDRCLLVAECCNHLKAKSTPGAQYTYVLEADYSDPDNDYHFLQELQPHLYFVKQDGSTTTHYLLELFDATLPHYRVKIRLKAYVDYLLSGDWERSTGGDKPPIVLLAFPTTAELLYAKRRIRKLLEDEGMRDDENIHIRLTTIENIKTHGVTSTIWEEV